ncbi:redoxin family protein [Carboxylicivirga sp. N1Y90]|uniref:redoxin family protein n=1 Tax=Carboxylicivirga fragile TaxID=3417571 RepID=UPI003D339B4C|nr:AhpC/TSA family protein [Marinilabiliaceae bacterium N1Y90]
MKNILFILSLVLLAACTTNNTVTITGKITNPESDAVVLRVSYNSTVDTIATLIDDGTFSATINTVDERLAYLSNGKSAIRINLKPGTSMHIEFDGNELKTGNKEKLVVSGEGIESTTLLLELSKINPIEDMRTLLSYPAPKFEEVVTSNAKAITDKISAYEVAYPDDIAFIEKIKLNEKVMLAQDYEYFTMYHGRLAPQDTVPIPEAFKTYGDVIPLDQYEVFKEINAYKSFVVNKHMSNIDTKLEKQNLEPRTVAFTDAKFSAILSLEIPQLVKDELGNRMLGSYTYEKDSIKTILKSRYKEIITNEKYTSTFEELLTKLEKLQPGSPAPTFAYNDINGKLIDSKELKGKVIYIDVWATWCGPCKGEIPHLKKLEEELHAEDIAFVSISVDEDKAAWETMVAEKELGGYQLFAPSAWESSIVKDYAIRGIPRFIIIDKEGNLVDANASRPSNIETKSKLVKLAKS